MKKYYKYYPRGFANEFEIYSVDPEKEKEFQEFYDSVKNDPNADIERITRKEVEPFIRKFDVYPFGMDYEEFMMLKYKHENNL